MQNPTSDAHSNTYSINAYFRYFEGISYILVACIFIPLHGVSNIESLFASVHDVQLGLASSK